ncbi:MAG: Ig-like domain-containing protein [Clostridia bacterium]|nr:Ig-like domain-containing protein [Clostridia bacterium]
MKINGIFKKTVITALTLMTACTFVFAVGGCKKKKKNTQQAADGVTITLNQKTLALDLDETFTLVATVTGTEENVVWSTDDAAVATVDANGVVTGVEDGETKIHATIGEDKASCTVTVEEGLRGLPNFYIDYGTLTIYKDYTSDVVGVFRMGKEEQQISASDVVWSSSDSTVASVAGGTITGVKAGVASITAKYVHEGTAYEDTISVTVKEMVAYLVDTADDVIATGVTYGGKTNTAYATTQIEIEQIFGTQVSELTDFSGITFTSENEEIATVDVNGVITGVAPGKTTINVESISASGEVEIEVYTAINCKYDLDMLALAYALGVNETAWGTSAKYMLTQDIDYNGDIFIPIAANTGKGYSKRSVGKQWKTLLADETTYGISYADLVATGLNANYSNNYAGAAYFNATLDGNGHAVKNAKLMLDASLGSEGGTGMGYCTNFIGYMGTNGVLRNISIENLGLQSRAEAGYTAGVGETLPLVGADITADEYTTNAWTVPASTYMNCLGVFGLGAGTLENVYAEWNVDLGTMVSNRAIQNCAFGRWEGTAQMTDCLFVDNFSYEGGEKYYAYCAVSTGRFVADNLIIVSGNGRQNSATAQMSGTYTEYSDVAALQTAYNSDNALFNGFDDWTITLQNNELTCEITNGIAG